MMTWGGDHALFRARARRDVAPIQFALAGMNAHSSRDLPVARVRSARATAWTNGAALRHLRAHPTLSADDLEALDAMVGFAGRGLLVSTGIAQPAAAVG